MYFDTEQFLENLFELYFQCRKNKRYSFGALTFSNLLLNIITQPPSRILRFCVIPFTFLAISLLLPTGSFKYSGCLLYIKVGNLPLLL